MTTLRSFASLAGRPGIDEAWSRLTPAQAKAAGLAFVVGYVSEDTSGKNITRAEVDGYRLQDVAVLLVYEYSITAVEGGAVAGARDAGTAVGQARALGYPTGCALAFAVDEDESGHPGNVDAYARAFTAACRAAGYRSMEYGGLATVRRCADLGLTDLHWQTYAWSGGVWDPRATIRQVQNDITISGHSVDRDVAMTADIGAWGEASMAIKDDPDAWAEALRMRALCLGATTSWTGSNADVKQIWPNVALQQILANQAAEAKKLDAATTAINALATAIQQGGGSVDTVPIVAAIGQLGQQESAAVAALQTELAAYRAAEAAAAQAEADALKTAS